MLAGFLTYPKSDLPILCSDSGVSRLFIETGITVAGTVSESHRIPFYTAAGSGCITKASVKLEIIPHLNASCYLFIKNSHPSPSYLPPQPPFKKERKNIPAFSLRKKALF